MLLADFEWMGNSKCSYKGFIDQIDRVDHTDKWSMHVNRVNPVNEVPKGAVIQFETLEFCCRLITQDSHEASPDLNTEDKQATEIFFRRTGAGTPVQVPSN